MASPLPTTLVRSNDGFLSAPEQRLLQWLAPRLPGWITPNLLTAFGFAGSVIALASYAIVERHPSALWLVNVGLIVNWLGDSLDGKIARLRGIERPRYGLFLDQSVDVLAQLLFVAGLAATGYVRVEIVATGFATFLMMNVQGLLRAEIRRVFPLAAGGIGLTEIRCAFFIANAGFYSWPPRPFDISGVAVTYADILGAIWITTNLALYLTIMVSELVALARDDRPRNEGAREP